MKTVSPESDQSALPLATQAATSEPSAAQLLQSLIDRGDPEKNIGVLERLIALKERSDAKQAEREFAQAFHSLQAEMPGIQAMEEVPDKQGNVKYVFAPYEYIMREVRPLLIKHGFSVTFDSEFKELRLVMRCTLLHIGGHSRTTTQYMRVSAPYGANDSQADGATSTMAKRYALCCALNIVVERDTDGRTDARVEGMPISFEQSQTLKELVKETRSDERAFLKYAGAGTYEEIGSNRYQELFRTLQAKLSRGAL